uniref:Uncharacterized protein n=1 Tax=Parascaris univalens TaxID=6257 RepID=A0A915ABZ9_PARUN
MHSVVDRDGMCCKSAEMQMSVSTPSPLFFSFVWSSESRTEIPNPNWTMVPGHPDAAIFFLYRGCSHFHLFSGCSCFKRWLGGSSARFQLQKIFRTFKQLRQLSPRSFFWTYRRRSFADIPHIRPLSPKAQKLCSLLYRRGLIQMTKSYITAKKSSEEMVLWRT